jgi:glycosyltransferase involved in cell wall biosynthesis
MATCRQVPSGGTVPAITACIVTYQRPAGLARLLHALAPQVSGKSERSIVVVNDGSNDASYHEVVSRHRDYVTYVPLPANRGIAFARNEAARNAAGDWIAFIDDDCVPPPYWLDWLAAAVAESPEIEVIAGAVKPLPPVRPNFFGRVQIVHGLHPYPERIGDQIRFVTANLAVRRQAFEQLGGFRVRDNFPNAAEDTEFASRVSRSALARRIDWLWHVHHDVGDGFRVNLRRYWRYGHANGWLHYLTASPPFHDWQHMLAESSERWRPLRSLAMRRAQAQGKYPSRLGAFASAVMAAMIDDAYQAGLRAAGLEWKRHHQGARGSSPARP